MTEIFDVVIELLSCAVGSYFFCGIFNGRGRALFFGALGGVIGWGVYLLTGGSFPEDLISYLIASMVITLYSEVLARIKKAPTTVFLVPSLIPLVPGGHLFYTMQFFINKQYYLFAQRGLYTISVAGVLALGIMLATTVTKPIFDAMKGKSQKGLKK